MFDLSGLRRSRETQSPFIMHVVKIFLSLPFSMAVSFEEKFLLAGGENDGRVSIWPFLLLDPDLSCNEGWPAPSYNQARGGVEGKTKGKYSPSALPSAGSRVDIGLSGMMI